MSVKDSLINNEVRAILDGEDNPSFLWEVILHTQEKTSKRFRIVNHTIFSNMVDTYTDVRNVSFEIPAGEWYTEYYPHRQTLEVTIIKTHTKGIEAVDDNKEQIFMERFRALPPEGKSVSIEGGLPIDISSSDLDRATELIVDLQLIDPIEETLRNIYVGSIYKDVVPAQLVQYLLTRYTTNISSNPDNKIKGVDLVDGYNQTPRKQLIIDQRTPLSQVPRFIQDNFGVYAADIGFYLKSLMWYVYPLYDHTRFNKEEDVVTIVILPAKQTPIQTRTYRLNDKHLFILIFDTPEIIDNTESNQVNLGNGTRFIDAERLFGGYGEVEDNKFTIDRGSNSYEFKSYDRKGGVQVAPVNPDMVTANPFKVYSEQARNNSPYLTVKWYNGDHSLLYPGMPARIITWEGEEVVERNGTLLSAVSNIERAGNRMTMRYEQNTLLTLSYNKTF